MPIATSRWASLSPNSPIPTPVRNVKPTRPAKVCPRSTRKNPTVPASTAATPEAAKAVRMKSYSNMGVVVVARMSVMVVVAMRLALDVDLARHHEIAVLDVDDFDIRPVEARQHRPGDHLVDRADHCPSPAEIENAIDRVDQRIELVGAEHDRDLEVVADAASDLDDALLMRRIERDQRLVEQQQPRPAEQRLAQQHPLALAAAEFADRAAGEVARAHFVERPVDLAPRSLVEPDE